jgi:hypothetical protein
VLLFQKNNPLNIKKGCRRVNMVEYYVLMYENGKMRPTELFQEWGRGIEESDGGCEFKYDIL